jgi:hypothetical protein
MYVVQSLRTFLGTNAERTGAGLAAFLPGDEYIETDTNDIFVYDGTAWVAKGGSGGTPGGSGGEFQYNNGGAFDGAANVTYDDATGRVTADASLVVGTGATVDAATVFSVIVPASPSGSLKTIPIFNPASTDANTTSFDFSFLNTTPVQNVYARIEAGQAARTAGSESGELVFSIDKAGTFTPVMRLLGNTGQTLLLNQDVIVYGTSNDSLLTTDYSTNIVGIGTNGAPATIASFAPSAIVLNNAEANIDVRIAGNGVTNGIVYDAGNDRTGLGTNTPATKLHVYHPVDTLADFAHFGDGTYGFWFRNATGGGFAPHMYGVTEEADDPLIFGVQIDPAIDTGTRACFWLDARQSDSTPITTRPIVQITNLGVSQLGVYPGGHVVCETTTGAFRPNTLTTTQRNALTAVNGMFIYNSTTGKFQGRAAGSWVDLH